MISEIRRYLGLKDNTPIDKIIHPEIRDYYLNNGWSLIKKDFAGIAAYINAERGRVYKSIAIFFYDNKETRYFYQDKSYSENYMLRLFRLKAFL